MPRKNLYLSLTDKIEQYISQLEPGTRLPSEQVLSDHFKTSKPTLRKALKNLLDNGYISVQNGIGNTVNITPTSIKKELIFVCSDLQFFSSTLKNFSSKVANSNYISSIIPISGSPETQKRILHSVFERKPAGIVLYTGDLELQQDLFSGLDIPVLHLIRRHFGLAGDVLSFRNEDSAADIIKHFYGAGCRKIAIFGSRVNSHAMRERLNGFMEGFRKVRLRPRQELICTDPSGYDDFFINFQTMRRPQAVCCLNDYCAGEFFIEMKKRGLPLDGICVSGFDCSPVTMFYPSSILTVKLPLEELGDKAAELLIRRIENPKLSELHEKLSSELIYTKLEYHSGDISIPPKG